MHTTPQNTPPAGPLASCNRPVRTCVLHMHMRRSACYSVLAIGYGVSNVPVRTCAVQVRHCLQSVTVYFANRLSGLVMALNSRALPEGSWKNMVHWGKGSGRGGGGGAGGGCVRRLGRKAGQQVQAQAGEDPAVPILSCITCELPPHYQYHYPHPVPVPMPVLPLSLVAAGTRPHSDHSPRRLPASGRPSTIGSYPLHCQAPPPYQGACRTKAGLT